MHSAVLTAGAVIALATPAFAATGGLAIDAASNALNTTRLVIGMEPGRSPLHIIQPAASRSATTATAAGLTADAASVVDYVRDAPASGTLALVTLNQVVGSSGNPAVVHVSQTATGATINLTVNGGGYAMGTIPGSAAGINIVQASPGALLVATFTAGASGYTVNIRQ